MSIQFIRYDYSIFSTIDNNTFCGFQIALELQNSHRIHRWNHFSCSYRSNIFIRHWYRNSVIHCDVLTSSSILSNVLSFITKIWMHYYEAKSQETSVWADSISRIGKKVSSVKKMIFFIETIVNDFNFIQISWMLISAEAYSLFMLVKLIFLTVCIGIIFFMVDVVRAKKKRFSSEYYA